MAASTGSPRKGVIDLLNLFECTVKKLREEVVVALCAFDPADPYWLCVSDDSDSDENLTLEKELDRLHKKSRRQESLDKEEPTT